MIILTFDDALLDTYKIAFPIMKERNVKGVVFVPTGLITGEIKTVRKDDAKYMTLKQIRELHEAGWEIGSHSHTHPMFDKLTLQQARRELEKSKQLLTDWGFEPVSFAFPYGHGYYTAEQVELANEVYKYVRTVKDFNNCPGKLIYGIPLDHGYPPRLPFLASECTTYVFHVIKSPDKFAEWLSRIFEKKVTFKEAGDRIKEG